MHAFGDVSTWTERQMSSKLLLTFEEAAACLSLGRSAFYELVRAGEIAITYVGPTRSVRRVHIEDLRAYADSLRQRSAGDGNGDRDSDGRQRTSDWGRRISLAKRARNRARMDNCIGDLDTSGER
ncbi:MAG: hypothetical protein KatS3mg060_1196 [Dehalococcoidia bacterium]|nr:MAG: hypothetical protein KatS3mg060_1196 [Dehalococcoidia bacterium]